MRAIVFAVMLAITPVAVTSCAISGPTTTQLSEQQIFKNGVSKVYKSVTLAYQLLTNLTSRQRISIDTADRVDAKLVQILDITRQLELVGKGDLTDIQTILAELELELRGIQ